MAKKDLCLLYAKSVLNNYLGEAHYGSKKPTLNIHGLHNEQCWLFWSFAGSCNLQFNNVIYKQEIWKRELAFKGVTFILYLPAMWLLLLPKLMYLSMLTIPTWRIIYKKKKTNCKIFEFTLIMNKTINLLEF